MKRAPQLRDLSDDHHRALVLAKRAREAAASGNVDDVAAQWRVVRGVYKTELGPHFAVEEAYLVPPIRIRDATGEELVRRLEADHSALRHRILNGPYDAPGLAAFAERLHAHVRFEERELFPFAERHLSRRELQEVGQAHAAALQSGQEKPQMNPNAAVEMLMKEHELILKVVEGLKGLAAALRSGRAADPALLREAIEFMREFADRCHHAKEEDLLFPAFVEHGVPLHGCPIDALLHEHEQGRKLVRSLVEGTDAYGRGEPGAVEVIAGAIDGIVGLYPNHIWKEDQMVFPMAGRLLPEDARAALYAAFEAVEAENPPGTHERFHAFAEQLMAAGRG